MAEGEREVVTKEVHRGARQDQGATLEFHFNPKRRKHVDAMCGS